MPNILLLDSLMAAFVFVVLLLSLVRDQRAHLTGEVSGPAPGGGGPGGPARHGVRVDQRGPGADGHRGRRTAAQRRGSRRSWAARSSLTEPRALAAADGRTTRRSPTPSTPTAPRAGCGCSPCSSPRCSTPGPTSVVAIVRDVTTEQRRIEELASFAAVAAHDLKGPLAAVQGWLEVAEDALEGDDRRWPSKPCERGRHATDRMSREIEDWLTYNVAREGVVQPEPIALQPYLDAARRELPRRRLRRSTPPTP